MTRMFKIHRETYPGFHTWLRDELPQIEGSDVWKAFINISKLSESAARAALDDGADPRVMVTDLANSDGRFRTENPRQIEIAKNVVELFESQPSNPEIRRFSEAKVLHEIVHWADFNADGKLTTGTELGFDFEVAAYNSEQESPAPQPLTSTRGPGATLVAPAPLSSAARGIRNNNPGNIRIGAQWQGLAEPSEMNAVQRDENQFCVFVGPEWGIRAMARVLLNYQKLHSLHTVEKMIKRYAPPSENVTEAYIKHVCQVVGIDRAAPFLFSDMHFARPMVTAMIKHENNVQPYDQEVIDQGLRLAGIT